MKLQVPTLPILNLKKVSLIGFFCLLSFTPAFAWEASSLPPFDPNADTNNSTQPTIPSESNLPTATVTSSPSQNNMVSDDYFNLQGHKIFRWNDQTHYLMIYISDGQGLPGWRPEDPYLVQAAFNEWEEAMNHRIHFIYMPDKRGSDVTISWRAAPEKQTNGSDRVGINEMMTYGKYIGKNDINIVLNNEEGYPYSDAAIQSVTLHEIGHMLGIKVHSNDPGDIMYPSVNLSADMMPRHLTQRDINTLNRIYSVKPNYTNPDNIHLSDFDTFRKQHPGKFRVGVLWIPISGIPIPIPYILPF